MTRPTPLDYMRTASKNASRNGRKPCGTAVMMSRDVSAAICDGSRGAVNPRSSHGVTGLADRGSGVLGL